MLTPSYSEDSYNVAFAHRFAWLDRGRTFLWACEKDGWRHLYRIDLAGNPATLITSGEYDVLALKGVDEAKGFVYFTASPENATQAYLYRTKLSGMGGLEKLTPKGLEGTHDYSLSPGAGFASHNFTNVATRVSNSRHRCWRTRRTFL